jgi:NADH:ubiquinone oxidoreductase subunit K
MDFAGTEDSKIELDIVNAIAIKIMCFVHYIQTPSCLLFRQFLLLIHKAEAKIFLKLINRVTKMLPVDDEVWSSVFFVINNKEMA